MTHRLLNLPVVDGGKVHAPDVMADEDRLWYIAKAAVDCDGSGGNPYNDPYFQPDTSYHHEGKALNPYEVPFIVVPPQIVKGVKPIVLGCKARMTNLKTGARVTCIVGDIGPKDKLGEASCKACEAVGLDPNPNHGGTGDYGAILYELYPGVETVIDGVAYALQPS